jgi:hypothetical protein
VPLRDGRAGRRGQERPRGGTDSSPGAGARAQSRFVNGRVTSKLRRMCWGSRGERMAVRAQSHRPTRRCGISPQREPSRTVDQPPSDCFSTPGTRTSCTAVNGLVGRRHCATLPASRRKSQCAAVRGSNCSGPAPCRTTSSTGPKRNTTSSHRAGDDPRGGGTTRARAIGGRRSRWLCLMRAWGRRRLP